ncbi:hypothetical protein [Nonomuraea jabiensis]|uniref:Uncharacterized protein n=1 Tax=Nonomuraea jabiensis TaxID=882448 RepID=A0A7W9LCC8_9ACTN|nr:hypothetical protein [Nonomuraea jabiensis]MBB5778662.1 hypothetical protein [Nonomuraea jabiensis]
MNANTQTTTRYMYLMTVLIGSAQATVAGTFDAKPGTSRLAVYTHIVENRIKRELGVQQLSILYFSLEPDALGVSV